MTAQLASITREEQFRQTRHENQKGIVSLSYNSVVIPVINWSRTGIGFELDARTLKFSEGQVLSDLAVSVDNVPVFKGDVEIRTARQVDEHTYFYGASFSSALLMVEGIEAALRAQQFFSHSLKLFTELQTLDPRAMKLILDLRVFLETLKNATSFEESKWKDLPFDRRCEAERVFLPEVSKFVTEVLMRFNSEFSKIVDVDTLPESNPYQSVFEQQIYPYFITSDVARRAFEKPRGYAGDYEMMNQIYRSGVKSHPIEGDLIPACEGTRFS